MGYFRIDKMSRPKTTYWRQATIQSVWRIANHNRICAFLKLTKYNDSVHLSKGGGGTSILKTVSSISVDDSDSLFCTICEDLPTEVLLDYHSIPMNITGTVAAVHSPCIGSTKNTIPTTSHSDTYLYVLYNSAYTYTFRIVVVRVLSTSVHHQLLSNLQVVLFL